MGKKIRLSASAFWSAARHHGVTAAGPVSVSLTNFLTTLAVLRLVSKWEFGEFSFVIVAAGLCVSAINGLLAAGLISITRVAQESRASELQTYLKCSVAFSCALFLAVCGVTVLIGVPVTGACLFGLYAGGTAFRYVARTYAYTRAEVGKVVSSDFAYSATLFCGVLLIVVFPQNALVKIAFALMCSIFLSLLPFGRTFARALKEAMLKGKVRAYGRIWRDITRWSLLGAITSELTLNAHAYLVTFIDGSGAFALLAVGALFMRPFSLVLTALPEREGPVLARLLAEGALDRARRTARDYGRVVGVLWTANQILSAAVLLYFPQLIERKGYAISSIILVVMLWALIAAVRGARAPHAMVLLSSRRFKALAYASLLSCIVALVGTLTLLLLAGPTSSLLGILAGDIVLWLAIRAGALNALGHAETSAALPQADQAAGVELSGGSALWAASKTAA